MRGGGEEEEEDGSFICEEWAFGKHPLVHKPLTSLIPDTGSCNPQP